MNISTIEANRYEHFNKIEDLRKRNAQINAVKYIKTLASMSNTNIMHWDILALFDKGDALLTERSSINKVFFSYRENAPANPTSVTEDKYAKLLRLTTNRARYSCNDLLERAVSKKREAIRYYDDYYLRYLKEANGYMRRYQAMQGYTPNYAEEIEKLCSDGFYQLHEVTDDSIVFHTVNDIILVHIDARHGVKRSVNLGMFSIGYNLLNSRVRVVGIANNINANGYCHPHVSSNNICFGELQPEAHDYIASGNLTQTMLIVQKALSTYNDDSPYRSLLQFEDYGRLEAERDEADYTDSITDATYDATDGGDSEQLTNG